MKKEPINYSQRLYVIAGGCLFIGLLLALIQGITVPECNDSMCTILDQTRKPLLIRGQYPLAKEVVLIFYSSNFKWFMMGMAGISFIGALVRGSN